MDNPITVCIPTYSTPDINRHLLVCNTVKRLQQNLYYSGLITYLISYQGIPIPPGLFDGMNNTTNIPCPDTGFGANLNNLLNNCKTDLIFQTDDDIELIRPINLNAHAQKLAEDDTAGWIRLMWIGHHRYIADLGGGEFPTGDPRNPLDGHYWRVRWNSPEHYIPSCRPHIKHKRFHDYFGIYPEGLQTGETENAFCQICKNKSHAQRGDEKMPMMLIPLMVLLPDDAWRHMGVQSFRIAGV